MQWPPSEVITERGRKKYATIWLKNVYFIDRSPKLSVKGLLKDKTQAGNPQTVLNKGSFKLGTI